MESAYENLPVYKAAFDLAEYIDLIVTHFAKRHKYTVGAKLLNASIDTLLLVTEAATKRSERRICLGKAIDKLESMKILLRFSKQRRAFNCFKSFEVAVRKVVGVSKQCEGWLKCQNSPGGK